MATFPPPWESGPGPADPAISGGFGSYTGSGYGQIGQGTIGAGNIVTVTPGGPPAQLRFYMVGNSLVALDNNTGISYAISAGGTIAQPPIYSPTK